MNRSLLAVVLLLVLAVAGGARAAGGPLDPTFDGDGLVLTNGLGVAEGVALQADGKVVVAGTSDYNVALARYHADGSLDTTFGSGGTVVTDLGQTEEAHDLAIQPDGKIVVVGNAGAGFGPAADVLVLRYNADGSLDPSFDGDGIAVHDLGGGERWFGVAVRADGKIVVGGGRLHTAASGFDRYQFAAGRYNADGTLDTTFDGDGHAFVDFGDGGSEALDVVLQPDGRMIAAGWSEPDPDGVDEADFALARFSLDGSLDATFDGDGRVLTNITQHEVIRGVTLQADGKIVAAGATIGYAVGGTNGWDFAHVRYAADGSLDSSFGGDGRTVDDFGSHYDEAYDVAVQLDGRIVTVGHTVSPDTDMDFAVTRRSSDGTLDASFDGDGWAATDFGAGRGEFATSVALQADGKLVAAGIGNDGTLAGFGLARYSSPLLPPPAVQCADGVDNDGDGKVDFPADPGCASAADDSESPDPALETPADGKVTGGGWFGPAKKTFALSARTTGGVSKGSLTYRDKAARLKLSSTTVTSVVVAGTQAVITGTGRVGKTFVTWRVEVDDRGEPGRGRDTFRISWEGYGAGGVLGGGNVHVHG